MNNRTIRRATLTALTAAAMLAGGAIAAYAATQHTAATATDNVVRTGSSTPLSATGGVFTPVLTLRLPAGGWVLSGAGTVVDWGPSDFTRCRIVVGGHQIASVATMVGDGSAGGAHGSASFVAPVSLTGAIQLSQPATAQLQCWHDSTVSSTGYLDSGASLYAHQTASLFVAME